MDDYKAAELQAEAIENAKPWYERPFYYFWLGTKWVAYAFVFIGLTHDMVKFIVDPWWK